MHLVADRFEFDEARNTMVFVCARVRDGAPVLWVSHDENGDWQFLCGGDHSDPETGDGDSYRVSSAPLLAIPRSTRWPTWASAELLCGTRSAVPGMYSITPPGPRTKGDRRLRLYRPQRLMRRVRSLSCRNLLGTILTGESASWPIGRQAGLSLSELQASTLHNLLASDEWMLFSQTTRLIAPEVSTGSSLEGHCVIPAGGVVTGWMLSRTTDRFAARVRASTW
jgi:hypothetical protein